MAATTFRFILIISVVQVTISFIASLLWPSFWASILAGSCLSLLNLWILSLAWLFIFYKKRVAPSVSVVVIKYGILILIFSRIPQTGWIHQNAFVLGVLINPVALLVGGILAKLIQNNRGN